MLNDILQTDKVYIACGFTDLRKGVDGLIGIIQNEYQLDPFQRSLFLFCGRRRDRMKGIFWDANGFVLVYKRLEEGGFQWPRTPSEAREITTQQFRWLMEGLKVDQPKVNKAVETNGLLFH